MSGLSQHNLVRGDKTLIELGGHRYEFLNDCYIILDLLACIGGQRVLNACHLLQRSEFLDDCYIILELLA